ncbi:CgeB family protein [Rhodopila sp.]|uniref:CgeB family protein n=1 Tax=Rhodopila sp. TaxID=2480087 RepID=UPI003D13C0AA
MRIAFYGSSLLSSYWNGAATYYRGILAALARLGYEITFYEPDAFDRQSHRDIGPPSWASVRVYPATADAVRGVLAEAAKADIVVKASGVGVFDDALLTGAIASARPDALRVFWDVDAPATLAEMRADPANLVRQSLAALDLVLTYGGGVPVVDAYTGFGARRCAPIYNALDPETHYPVSHDPAFTSDLSLLANRMPDREARAADFFLQPASRLTHKTFLLGGSGWHDASVPPNVRRLGHVGTHSHNAFNVSARAVLNVARDNMASTGFCPATRVFEAAGAGGCLITDAWEGIEMFLAPGQEVLVARDGHDVVDYMSTLSAEAARAIGKAARLRVLAEHTYAHRAALADAVFRDCLMRKRAE